MEEVTVSNRPYWFVGALHGGTNDKFNHFIEEGIWVNGYEHKYTQQVKSMQVGGCD